MLKEHELSQVEIMRLTEMYKTHTSKTLKELTDKKLIVCTNPDDRAFLFYKITKKGKDILREVERISGEE